MPEEIYDMEDERFEQLLADKQHKELMSAIRKLIQSLSVTKKDDNIAGILSKNNEIINVFLGKVSELKKPEIKVESPQVKVETNYEYVAAVKEQNKLLESVAKNQEEILAALKNKPTKLTAIRNDYGTIQYIDIKY